MAYSQSSSSFSKFMFNDDYSSDDDGITEIYTIDRSKIPTFPIEKTPPPSQPPKSMFDLDYLNQITDELPSDRTRVFAVNHNYGTDNEESEYLPPLPSDLSIFSINSQTDQNADPINVSPSKEIVRQVSQFLRVKRELQMPTPNIMWELKEPQRLQLLDQTKELEQLIQFNFKQIQLLNDKIKSSLETVKIMQLSRDIHYTKFKRSYPFKEYLNSITDYEEDLTNIREKIEGIRHKIEESILPDTLRLEYLQDCYKNGKDLLSGFMDRWHEFRNKVEKGKHDLNLLCNHVRHMRIHEVPPTVATNQQNRFPESVYRLSTSKKGDQGSKISVKTKRG